MQKYGFDEARPVLERASARETAARVALGAVAAAFLEQAIGTRLVSHVVSIGAASSPAGAMPTPDDVERLDADPVRCFDPGGSAAMVAEIDQAHKDGDTLGGVVEVRRLRAAARDWARTCTGTAGSTRGWPAR